MLRYALALLLAVLSWTASAGTRAVYVAEEDDAVEIEIADNGDVGADLGNRRRLVVRGGEAFVVENRLTGPLVMRVADLEALAGDDWKRLSGRIALKDSPDLRAIGTDIVNGRPGSAFSPSRSDGKAPEPLVVLSDDPALAGLGRAARQVFAARALLMLRDRVLTGDLLGYQAGLLRSLGTGTPLRFGWLTLGDVEPAAIPPGRFALPALPESREKLRARFAREAREEARGDRDSDIVQAAFSGGRLWLLTAEGGLASLAPAGTRLTRHDSGGAPIALCAGADGPTVATSDPSSRTWTVKRWRAGRWARAATVRWADDAPVALACVDRETLFLTSGRLIALGRGAPRTLDLVGELSPARVRSVVHATPRFLFVGINAGEWGGGLRRIDRITGEVRTVERNDSGDLCDGPLNAACDPVHGIATIPWRPDCVAAAVGLVHMLAHGRIVRVCGDRVDQLFAQASDRRLTRPQAVADAARGRYGAVPFFGLAATGGSLLAAGQDGLYRLESDGRATHRDWPRFKAVDGVLVSFELPGTVLVLTTANRRASVGGAAPLLVPR